MKMFPNIKILEKKYTFLNKSKKNLSFLSSAVHQENKRDKSCLCLYSHLTRHLYSS